MSNPCYPSTEYKQKHLLCPECGKADYAVTTSGIGLPMPDGAWGNPNRVECRCGFVGIGHDLTPEDQGAAA